MCLSISPGLGPQQGTCRLGTSLRCWILILHGSWAPKLGELEFAEEQPEPTEVKSTHPQAWRGRVRGKNLPIVTILWPWLENLCGCMFNFPIESPNESFKRTIMSFSVELFQDLRLFIRKRIRKQKRSFWTRRPNSFFPTKCDPLSLPSSYFQACRVFTKKAL